jgi:hypothetical protein
VETYAVSLVTERPVDMHHVEHSCPEHTQLPCQRGRSVDSGRKRKYSMGAKAAEVRSSMFDVRRKTYFEL